MQRDPLSDLFPVIDDVAHTAMELKAQHMLEGVLLIDIIDGIESAFEALEGLVILRRGMERRYQPPDILNQDLLLPKITFS